MSFACTAATLGDVLLRMLREFKRGRCKAFLISNNKTVNTFGAKGADMDQSK